MSRLQKKSQPKTPAVFFDDFEDEPAAEVPVLEEKEELAPANTDKESVTNFFDEAVEDFFADKEDINTEMPSTENPVEQDLIDKFIREEPRLEIDQERAKNEERDIWEERETEESFPATERLAKIYEEQGHIEWAIAVYRKLQLKFPKKSAYFANQIEKLNTL